MSKTPTLDAIAKLKAGVEEAHEKIDRFLEKQGWKNTSDTPGCFWMWEKKLKDGRVILTDQDGAVRFEAQMCGEDYGCD